MPGRRLSTAKSRSLLAEYKSSRSAASPAAPGTNTEVSNVPNSPTSALEAIAASLRERPLDGDLYAARARLLNDLGAHDDAWVAWSSCKAVATLDDDALVDCGICLLDNARWGEALDHFDKVRGGSALALAYRAFTRVKLGESDVSDDIAAALALNSSLPATLEAQTASLRALDCALLLDVSRPTAHLARARFLLARGELHAARASLDACHRVASGTDFVDCVRLRAAVRGDLGDDTAALADWEATGLATVEDVASRTAAALRFDPAVRHMHTRQALEKDAEALVRMGADAAILTPAAHLARGRLVNDRRQALEALRRAAAQGFDVAVYAASIAAEAPAGSLVARCALAMPDVDLADARVHRLLAATVRLQPTAAWARAYLSSAAQAGRQGDDVGALLCSSLVLAEEAASSLTAASAPAPKRGGGGGKKKGGAPPSAVGGPTATLRGAALFAFLGTEAASAGLQSLPPHLAARCEQFRQTCIPASAAAKG